MPAPESSLNGPVTPSTTPDVALKTWRRFQQVRDTGHDEFVKKAEKCEAFYRGEQWDAADAAKLKKVGRPYLTINKVKPTVRNVVGEQVRNQAEATFRPRTEGLTETSEALSRVYKQVLDNNQMAWKRTKLFEDGVITSRGYYDMRLCYSDNKQGEISVCNVNPKNVIPDPDADDYDPDTWSDVIVTKWFTADDIAVLYGEDKAKQLRNRDSYFPYGYDSIDTFRDRFGVRRGAVYSNYDESNVERTIRVIDRQYRMLDRQKFFVETETGDMRAVPADFDADRIAWFTKTFGFKVTTQLVRRIRWTCVADNVVLHDDWSPYKHFTIIPYFPEFRYGRTLGMVEDLISPQENLNKVRSQELHVVNTTANSGWKVKAGALANMTIEELEEKGAQTGLAIEVNGDPDKDLQKIQPNNVPQGLDRVSFKSEEDIKTISGVSDSMQGFDREDVAAKAIQAKKQAGSTNLVVPMESLARTDYILARNCLDVIQEFYTEERLVAITGNKVTGQPEFMTVNQVTPEGQIKNDLTMGEYDVVIVTVPVRDTSEDSQFEQAMALKEAGVQIPDTVLIKNSRLADKMDIIKQMTGDQESPEGQARAQRQQRMEEAQVQGAEAEVAEKQTKAQLNAAKAQETLSPEAAGPDVGVQNAKVQHEMAIAERGEDRKDQVEMMKLNLQREKQDGELQIKAQAEQTKAEDARIARMQQAAQAAMKPQKPAE